MNRPSKYEHYLHLARVLAERGTCLRRNYGAIIVNNDEIVSTGYTGTPRGVKNCCDIGKCHREMLGCKPDERYDLCKSVHAEQNAIISAARRDMIGGTMFLAGLQASDLSTISDTPPCYICQRFIINAGLKSVVIEISPSFGAELDSRRYLQVPWKEISVSSFAIGMTLTREKWEDNQTPVTEVSSNPSEEEGLDESFEERL